jgi:two-component system sensor histidine kinase KdpD
MNFPDDAARRDPDTLLAALNEQERRAARGRLRIYFGASAGVGKTCAMLAAARQIGAGDDVVVGIVETHGRAETAALLEGLTVMPCKQVEYRGKLLAEFDIDAVLARRPRLVLVDELAHSNAPGSRHPKRWQDIEELLAAGIDVFTTVNVQHLDSLNDIVGGITGVRVNETVPDSVFDGADEVVLVDLPADELLARLRLGKVYQPAQAERAGRNFFRKGNLIALRELALRRTAERIGDDVRAYRIEKSIEPVWRTGAALLAGVGPGGDAEGVVRSAARLAAQLGAEWHAVYVETPALLRLDAGRRARILAALKLAGSLGATTATLAADRVDAALVDYARSHNLARIALGRGRGGAPWRQSCSRRIARLAPEIELVEVVAPACTPGGNGRGSAPAGGAPPDTPRRPALAAHGGAALASLGMALALAPAVAHLDLANIAMLFLLVVLLVAMRLGRGPSVTATCVGVACFDYFFVPPRFSFAISDLQYLVTFGVMLAVGVITGHLAAGLRFQARVAALREGRTRALYEFARALSGVLQTAQIEDATRDAVRRIYGATRSRRSIPASRNGRSIMAPTPGSARTRCRAAPCSTWRWWRQCAPAACWPSKSRRAAACWRRNSASNSRRSRPWRPSRSKGCTISRSPRMRWSGSNRSGCAIRCWPRCRTTCARRSRRCWRRRSRWRARRRRWRRCSKPWRNRCARKWRA